MDTLQNIWNNIDSLHKLSSILQWISFLLIFFGLLSGISKYFVDQREKHLLVSLRLLKTQIKQSMSSSLRQQ